MTDRTEHGAAAKPRVTLKHVAEAAGLGVTTVSDILNGGDAGRTRYSRPTQEKVHRVVAELGYTVDRAAQQLRRGGAGWSGCCSRGSCTTRTSAGRSTWPRPSCVGGGTT